MPKEKETYREGRDEVYNQARSKRVNPPGFPTLTTENLYQVLVEKARDARPFVPGCTACEVIETYSESSFLRRAEIQGQELLERVTLYPPIQVHFHREQTEFPGNWITNTISESSDGLMITFASSQHFGEAGSQLEKTAAQALSEAYDKAINAVLSVARERQR